ncbi:hypothetical protein MMC13_006230 [Lambiella insularis]|nr:hypothetical protein [Lambiella insularis]
MSSTFMLGSRFAQSDAAAVMNKLCINAAFGRGRPLLSLRAPSEIHAASSRSLHVSSLRAEGEEVPLVKPISKRVLQNQRYTQEVQNLAQRAAQSSGTSFRSIKLDRSEGPGGAVDARSFGSNPSGAADRITGARHGFRGGPAFISPPDTRSGKLPRSKASGGGPGRGQRSRDAAGRGVRDNRGGDAREPRRRARGGGLDGVNAANAGRSNERNEEFEEQLGKIKGMEEAWQEVEEEVQPSSKPRHFELLDASNLEGNGPLLALGEWGMRELVDDKLERVTGNGLIDDDIRTQVLAKRLYQGGWVRFRDDEEKQSVQQLAKEMAEQKAGYLAEAKGEVVEPLDTTFQPLTENESEGLTQQIFLGAYGKKTYPQTVKNIVMKVRGSGAITERQEASLVKKVRSMLPVQRPPRPVAAPGVIAA